MEVYKIEKGKDLCQYKGYEYIVKLKKESGVIHWRCREVVKFKCNEFFFSELSGQNCSGHNKWGRIVQVRIVQVTISGAELSRSELS